MATWPPENATIQLKLRNDGSYGSTSTKGLANRSSALAGAAIQFDAGETDHVLFRNRFYLWDFGDSGSGNWSNGKSKNADSGPISGHVYDTPGSYTITCAVFDAAGLIETITDSVTITDPDVVYAGALTTCLSTGTDFTEAPAGANLVTETDLTLFGTYVKSNERLMLKRGDAWNVVAALSGNSFSGLSNVYITAFGTPITNNVAMGGLTAQEIATITSDGEALMLLDEAEVLALTTAEFNALLADENALKLLLATERLRLEIIAVGAFSNDPTITLTGPIGSYPMLSINYPDSWVISHLHMIGDSDTHSWSGGNTDLVNVTYRRNFSEGFYVPLGSANASTQGHIGLAYVENVITKAEGNCLFTGSEKLLLMGNQFSNASLSHVVRVWHANRWCARHNYCSGSSINNLNGRQLLKHHGPKESKVNPTGPWTTDELRTRSEFGVISDNLFGAGGPWPVSIAPQDAASDERLSALIVENNYLVGDFGVNSPILVSIAIRMEASNSVVRNNVIDCTGMSTSGITAVSIQSTGVVAQREGAEVYNNTVYLKEGYTYGNQARIFEIGAVLNCTIKNNLCSLPSTISPPPLFIIDGGTGTVQSSNLLTATPLYTDPDNDDPLLRDFSVLAGSPAIGAGEDVPVLRDRNGVARISGAYDLGAYQE